VVPVTQKQRTTRLSIREVAYSVLFEAKVALHVQEITARVLQRFEIRSRTPANSVNNALQKDPRVERVGRGVFQVRVQTRPAARRTAG